MVHRGSIFYFRERLEHVAKPHARWPPTAMPYQRYRFEKGWNIVSSSFHVGEYPGLSSELVTFLTLSLTR